MTQVSIKISGLPKVIDRFNKLSNKVKDFTPEFTALGEYLTQYYSGEAFLSEGQVFGKRWAKLKSSTISAKIKKYPGRQPLEATGEMRKGFEAKAGAKQLIVKNTSDHFKYHQSSRPRTRLPRRVMIGWNNTIKSKTKELITQGIERILHG